MAYDRDDAYVTSIVEGVIAHGFTSTSFSIVAEALNKVAGGSDQKDATPVATKGKKATDEALSAPADAPSSEQPSA